MRPRSPRLRALHVRGPQKYTQRHNSVLPTYRGWLVWLLRVRHWKYSTPSTAVGDAISSRIPAVIAQLLPTGRPRGGSQPARGRAAMVLAAMPASAFVLLRPSVLPRRGPGLGRMLRFGTRRVGAHGTTPSPGVQQHVHAWCSSRVRMVAVASGSVRCLAPPGQLHNSAGPSDGPRSRGCTLGLST